MLDLDAKDFFAIYAHRVGIETAFENLPPLQREAWIEVAQYAVELEIDETEPEYVTECAICLADLKCPSCDTIQCDDCGADLKCPSCRTVEGASVPPPARAQAATGSQEAAC